MRLRYALMVVAVGVGLAVGQSVPLTGPGGVVEVTAPAPRLGMVSMPGTDQAQIIVLAPDKGNTVRWSGWSTDGAGRIHYGATLPDAGPPDAPPVDLVEYRVYAAAGIAPENLLARWLYSGPASADRTYLLSFHAVPGGPDLPALPVVVR